MPKNPCQRIVVVLFYHSCREKKVHKFIKCISQKVKVISPLDIELTYGEISVQYVFLVSHEDSKIDR